MKQSYFLCLDMEGRTAKRYQCVSRGKASLLAEALIANPGKRVGPLGDRESIDMINMFRETGKVAA